MNHEPPLWLIVTGPPAAGKTTLVRRLAKDLGIALFEKDTIKDLLYKTLPAEVLVGRNAARLYPPNYRPNHHVMPAEELLGKLASGTWEPLDVPSQVIRVDTSDSLDYANLLQTIRPDPPPCPPPSRS